MTISDFAAKINAEILSLPDPGAEISGGYCGDLLSWVMGRAEEGQVWITIMSNINTVAVASLADVSGILLSENVEIDESVIAKAKEQGINLIRTEMSSFEAAVALGELIKK